MPVRQQFLIPYMQLALRMDEPHLSPRPFDLNRDGLVIGEGGGTLILEELEYAESRGAKIYAEMVGFGTNSDGSPYYSALFNNDGNSNEISLG